MNRRQALAFLIALAVATGVAISCREPPPPAPQTLPEIYPRGDVVRGVEVFTLGPHKPRRLVDLCEAAHGAISRLLGRPATEPRGLRIHVFMGAPECRDYTLRATGQVRQGAAYIFHRGQRLIVLHPKCDLGLLQHEVGHDAIQSSLGIVRRWFSEGLAVNLESWKWVGKELVRRPSTTWANRFLREQEAGTLPRHADVSSDDGFPIEDTVGAYARSWASVEALTVLRRSAGRPIDPDHGLAPETLDELGAILAEHWARPDSRLSELLDKAQSGSDPEERDLFLGIAELLVGRLGANPTVDPLGRSQRLARAVADGSSDARRRLRAASALVEGGTPPVEDWLRLARALEDAGAPRASAWAKALAKRAHPNTHEFQGAEATAQPPLRIDFAAEGVQLTLSSVSWDRTELELFGPRLAAALALLRATSPSLPTAWEFSVEVPGLRSDQPPGRRINGWPGQSSLFRGLAKTLSITGRQSAPADAPSWTSSALPSALRGLLDPAAQVRLEGAARGALFGPHRFDTSKPSASPDPSRQAVAALHLGTGDALEALRQADLHPCDLNRLAADPGHPQSGPRAEKALSGPLLRFYLLAGAYGGSESWRRLSEALDSSGKALSARTLKIEHK